MSLESEHLMKRIFKATLLNKAKELKIALRYLNKFPSSIFHDYTFAHSNPYPHLPPASSQQNQHYNNRRQNYDAAAPALRECLAWRSLWSQALNVTCFIGSNYDVRVKAAQAFVLLSECKQDTLDPPSDWSALLVVPPDYQSTPLHLGAALGHRHVVKVLLQQDDIQGNLCLTDSLGYTPLCAAVVSQEVSVVRMVLNKTVWLPAHVCKELFNEALDVAVALGGVDVVAELFSDVRFRRLVTWGPCLLVHPIICHHLEMVRFLVRMACKVPCGTAGASITKFPLHFAVYHYRSHSQEELEIVLCLLQHGADPNQQCLLDSSDGRTGTALHMALVTYEVTGRLVGPVPAIVHSLLDYHADPNARSTSWEPPLFWVNPSLCNQSLKLLLQYGANPLMKNNEGDTCLTSSTFLSEGFQQHEVDFVQVLLRQAPQLLSVGDKQGRTVLHHAVKKPQLFWFLLCSGADPSLRDLAGRTVLEHLLSCQTTVSEMVFRCLTLLMCIKGGVAFTRPQGVKSSMLSYVYPAGTAHSAINMKGQDLQLLMMEMLFEVGYLTANDNMQYYLQAVGTQWPSRILPSVLHLTRSPNTLTSICRRSFIQSLSVRPQYRDRAIASMNHVPNVIKKYLQFGDLIGQMASVLGWAETEIWSFFL